MCAQHRPQNVYGIQIRGRWHNYEALADANAAADHIMRRYGVLVGIVERSIRNRRS